MNSRILLTLLVLVGTTSCGGDSNNDNPTPTPTPFATVTPIPPVGSPTTNPTNHATPVITPVDNPPLGKNWTLAEIISEPRRGGSGNNVTCQGTRFKPCICANDVPSTIRYRPAVVECNSHAAVILYDNLKNSFSTVVRNSENSDREPAPGSGFGGCSKDLAASVGAPNKCSAYKTQEKINIPGGVVLCLGDDGYASPIKEAVRITIKIQNIDNSSADPLLRVCLVSGDKPLN